MLLSLAMPLWLRLGALLTGLAVALKAAHSRAAVCAQPKRRRAKMLSKLTFQKLLDNIPVGVWVKESDGTLSFANRFICESLNMKLDDVIGRTTHQLMPEIAAGFNDIDKIIMQKHKPYEQLLGFQLPDGTMRQFWVVKFVVESATGRTAGVCFDVTDKIKAEHEVRRLNTELLTRVQELERLKEEAVEALALKSAFVANINHEIRTPLTGIIGTNELLLQGALNAEQRELVETMYTSACSLLALLNDMLDVSRIESGQSIVEQVPFNLMFVVQDSARLMSAAAQAKNLTFSTRIDQQMPEFVVGDSGHLRQILLILISNAIKYTNKGGVSLETFVHRIDEDAANIEFVVRDTGRGIESEDIKKLFSPFMSSAGSADDDGLGFGLFICKSLVNQLGGQIEVESTPGVGSKFSFRLPFVMQPLPDSQAPIIDAARRDQRPLVLLVEDSPVLQLITSKQLASMGIMTVVAGDGAEAVDRCQNTDFDAVFMDINLPVMNGYEATRLIRDKEAATGRHTPIIAMTALAVASHKEACFAVGMDDYVSKPVSIAQLRELMSRWLPEPLKRYAQGSAGD